jgi:S-adenosyl methyltransferase
MAIEWSPESLSAHDEPLLFDTSVAHFARVYDYLLGGKDNFAVDREAAAQVISVAPDIALTARANRAFLARAVRFLAGEAGVHQFLDIGTGIPAANNTHEVAQFVVPGARVVYVDNDPFVLAHARALLAGRPEGATFYIDADLRDPARILDAASRLLDFRRPVAVMLMAILQHLDDEEDPHKIVATLMNAVPSGSYLALSHPAADIDPEQMGAIAERVNGVMTEKIALRPRATVNRFFSGLELADPGLVPVSRWRPVSEMEASGPGALWAGVARKD